MGAGGDAPPLRAQDVLMLVGLSLLVGSIVMLAWDDPVSFTEEEGISGNARLGGGDAVDMTYIMDQTSVVTIRFQLEGQEEVLITEAVAAGDTNTATFDVSERGSVSWSISVSEGAGEVDVDLKRGAISMVWAPLLGAVLVGYAVVLSRQEDGVSADAESLDAELLE